MTQLRNQKLLHRESDGGFGTGQSGHDSSGDETGACAAHHSGRADLLVAQHAKELAKPVEPLVEKSRHRFKRAIARGNPRSAGRDDALTLGRAQLPFVRSAPRVRSSLTIVCPTTSWPADRSRSTIARPPLSVASLRVSLIVIT